MDFCWITINVTDLEKSLSFYRDFLELDIDRRFKPNPDMEIVFLGKGETKVELIFNKNNTIAIIGNDVSFGFKVKSLEEIIRNCESKSITIQSGPFQPNPHIKFLYVTDPDGWKIQLVEEIV
ncbi:MAG: VOC family protein [Candidatus Delongbacteria bacterium]|nr:VOC family protein [Candidatus Delongbacteria bacterium]MBN2835905.1 VOC family protein [Candidatus Delongbacteria bacterium]